MIGTLGQMASTHLNNIYPRKVNKTWKQEKAAFENIFRSAAARIAATTLRMFDSLRFEETGRFVSFSADEIVLCTVNFSPVVSATSYKLSQQQQFKKPCSFIWRKRIQNYKVINRLSCHDPTGMFSGNESKRDNVGGERSYLLQILFNKPSKGV